MFSTSKNLACYKIIRFDDVKKCKRKISSNNIFFFLLSIVLSLFFLFLFLFLFLSFASSERSNNLKKKRCMLQENGPRTYPHASQLSVRQSKPRTLIWSFQNRIARLEAKSCSDASGATCYKERRKFIVKWTDGGRPVFLHVWVSRETKLAFKS